MPKNPDFYPENFKLTEQQSNTAFLISTLFDNTRSLALNRIEGLRNVGHRATRNQNQTTFLGFGRIPFIHVGSINPPTPLPPPPPLQGEIATSPRMVTFSPIRLDEVGEWQLISVQHSGEILPIEIQAINAPAYIEVNTSPSMANHLGAIPATLQIKDIRFFAVRCNPTLVPEQAAGDWFEVIEVVSNAGNLPADRIFVSGKFVAPPPVFGKIDLAPHSIPVETMPQGEATTWHQVRITNIGDGDLTITSIQVDAFSEITLTNVIYSMPLGRSYNAIPNNPITALPAVIAPGEWKVFAIRANPSPDLIGHYKSVVTIESSDSNDSSMIVTLFGQAIDNTPPPVPRIQVDVSNVRFGKVQENTISNWIVVDIQNPGDANLTVYGISSTFASFGFDYATPALFATGKAIGAFPATIPSGDYRSFAVRIENHPTPETIDEIISVLSDATNAPNYPLRATGKITATPIVLAPAIEVTANWSPSPNVLSFGSYTQASGIFPAMQIVRIRSSGNTDLQISSITATQANLAATGTVKLVELIFAGSGRILSPIGSGSATIPPGEFREFGVQYNHANIEKALAAEAQSQIITISSNAENDDPVTGYTITTQVSVLPAPPPPRPPIEGTIGAGVGGDHGEGYPKLLTWLNFLGGVAETSQRGIDIAKERQNCGATGDYNSFVCVGGDAHDRSVLQNNYERITYDTKQVAFIGSQISTQLSLLSGASSRTKGYLFGGDSTPGNEGPAGAINRVEFLPHGENSRTLIGARLAHAKAMFNNTQSVKAGVYTIAGGLRVPGTSRRHSHPWGHTPLDTIGFFDFGTEAEVTVGNAVGNGRWMGASFGNERFIYSGGGDVNTRDDDRTDNVIRFTVATRTAVDMGSVLSDNLMGSAGFGGINYGYITGGYKRGENIASKKRKRMTARVRRIKPMGGGETVVTLGVHLAGYKWNEHQRQCKAAGKSNYEAGYA